jgi:uncharacterized protein (UPF0332 family)
MSIEPKDILATAQKLLESAIPTESDLRSAASRAYYAALHASHIVLPNGLAPSASELHGKSSHEAIISALDVWAKAPGTGRDEAYTMWRNLKRLKATRKTADYTLENDFSIIDSQFAIKNAIEVLAKAARAKQKLANERINND